MPSKPFQPGDRVVWWKQTPGGGYVFPVLSTVLAVTAKRVKIEAEEGKVIRHALPGLKLNLDGSDKKGQATLNSDARVQKSPMRAGGGF